MNQENWDDFRYFLAAAETGSFSAAAKQLQSNQPTVGRHVDALEDSLGIKLFQRHTQGLTLTEEGLSILEDCQQMRSSIIKAQRTLGGKEGDTAGTVRLAVPEGISTELLIPQLGAFYQTCPEIQLILRVSTKAANLTRGEADIAIRLFRPKEVDLVIRKLTTMSMSLYASKTYVKNHSALKQIRDMKDHKFIAYGDSLFDLPENQWLTDNTDPQNIVLQTDSTFARLKATESSLGISIQPDLLAGKNGNLVKIYSNKAIPEHQVWLAYHDDIRHLNRIRVVVNFIVGLFETP